MVLLCGFYLVCAVFRNEYAGSERFTLKYASTDDASDVVPRPKTVVREANILCHQVAILEGP